MSITHRDIFECEYIRKYMAEEPYGEAKRSLEENRQGDTYSNTEIAKAWEDELLGVEW